MNGGPQINVVFSPIALCAVWAPNSSCLGRKRVWVWNGCHSFFFSLWIVLLSENKRWKKSARVKEGLTPIVLICIPLKSVLLLCQTSLWKTQMLKVIATKREHSLSTTKWHDAYVTTQMQTCLSLFHILEKTNLKSFIIQSQSNPLYSGCGEGNISVTYGSSCHTNHGNTWEFNRSNDI